MSLTKKFKSILWEYDLSELNLDDSIVVERVLNLGDKKLTDLWRKKLGEEKIKKLFLKNHKLLNKKSLNYWKLVFDIKYLSTNKSMYDKLNTPIFSRNFR